jgi:uncharacterized protein YdeI (BOF family)
MAFPDSISQRGYVQKETAWGTINNAGGVASLANGDAFLFTDLEMNDTTNEAERPDKTGDYDTMPGVLERSNGTWKMRCTLPGVGAVGDPPDIGPFVEALLGKQTIHAGVDVEYTPDDVNPGLSIWDFNALATAIQRVGAGCIVQRMTLTFGETFAYLDFSGELKCVVDTARFTGGSATYKSGLNPFPSEPAAPAVTGDANPGYMGVITVDGQAYATVRSGSIEVAVGRSLQKNAWNEIYPTGPMAGRRTVSFSLTLDDDDSASLTALKAKAGTASKITASLQIGNVAKNISLIALKEIRVPQPAYDYSQQRRGIVFSGLKSNQSALHAKDSISWKFK